MNSHDLLNCKLNAVLKSGIVQLPIAAAKASFNTEQQRNILPSLGGKLWSTVRQVSSQDSPLSKFRSRSQQQQQHQLWSISNTPTKQHSKQHSLEVYFSRMVAIAVAAATTSMLGRSLRALQQRDVECCNICITRDFRKSGLLPLMIKLLTSLFARCAPCCPLLATRHFRELNWSVSNWHGKLRFSNYKKSFS